MYKKKRRSPKFFINSMKNIINKGYIAFKNKNYSKVFIGENYEYCRC